MRIVISVTQNILLHFSMRKIFEVFEENENVFLRLFLSSLKCSISFNYSLSDIISMLPIVLSQACSKNVCSRLSVDDGREKCHVQYRDSSQCSVDC